MDETKSDATVTRIDGGYLVTTKERQWWVTEVGSLWDAWPYPECADPQFDDQAYAQEYLRGRGTTTAVAKIDQLIGTSR